MDIDDIEEDIDRGRRNSRTNGRILLKLHMDIVNTSISPYARDGTIIFNEDDDIKGTAKGLLIKETEMTLSMEQEVTLLLRTPHMPPRRYLRNEEK